MGDEAADAALSFLLDNAEIAGKARAEMAYFEDYRKVVLARLKRQAPASERSDAAREAWARDQKDYQDVLVAKYAAIEKFESLSWKKTHAEATIEAWRTRNANNRGAGRMQ
jgi:hypothetical protein